MPLSPLKLLGLAFASADVLIETRNGTIGFVLGATRELLGEDEAGLVGRAFAEVFALDDRPLVEAMIACAEDGVRRGPVILGIASDPHRHVQMVLRALPGNRGAISCGLTSARAVRPRVAASVLPARHAFEDMAKGLLEVARITGQELELAMVEFSDVARLRDGLSRDEAAQFDVRMISALRAEAHGGAAATQLSESRYAILRQRDEDLDTMVQRLSRLVNTQAVAQAIPVESGDPGRTMRAFRYALEDFRREGCSADAPESLTAVMTRSIKRTLAQAGALSETITQRRFALAFQPVVSLADGLAHHHEVLVRFEEGASPFAQIRLAEEFDLIEELDLAIVEQTIKRLANDHERKLRLAVNVSGRTIISETFVSQIERLLARYDAAKGRLIFEITETAAIDDLGLANQNIQALRSFGSMVCLDDFGAGSASFAYLQKLRFDIVKIDGRYVRELASNGRDGALVRRLVDLCHDLNIRTIAEMVETVDIEDIVRRAGVDFAQGWLYGRPDNRPAPALRPNAPPVAAARRRGAADSWG